MTTPTEAPRSPVKRLYIVVREDLSPAQQAVQGMHAVRAFVDKYPDEDSAWFKESNTIAFLSVRDLPSLTELIVQARMKGECVAPFAEPDIGMVVTAAAFSPACARLLRRLPLALSSYRSSDSSSSVAL